MPPKSRTRKPAAKPTSSSSSSASSPAPEQPATEPAEPTAREVERVGVFLRRPDGTIVVPIAAHGPGVRCVVIDRTDVLTHDELAGLEPL
jgi:hypothetical protein